MTSAEPVPAGNRLVSLRAEALPSPGRELLSRGRARSHLKPNRVANGTHLYFTALVNCVQRSDPLLCPVEPPGDNFHRRRFHACCR
jgi:hypothetical protein